MTEDEALATMVAPGTHRPGKYGSNKGFGGVIQILVTSSCDKACFSCTQASQLSRPKWFMTPEQFEQAVLSLKGYPGIVGLFGGNPALSPHLEHYCSLLRRHVPRERLGIWCNNPITLDKARSMRDCFNPRVSNLNVHLDQKAYDLFKQGWPECNPVGLHEDSRHSPPWVAMKDLKDLGECWDCGGGGMDGRPLRNAGPCQRCNGTGRITNTEENRLDLIADCDINKHWSAMVTVVRGSVKGFFCEIAGAQAVLHQDDPDWPDVGVPLVSSNGNSWWQEPMTSFAGQVKQSCHRCGIPLRGHGVDAQSVSPDDSEQVSDTHRNWFVPKRAGRRIELVVVREQLGTPLRNMTRYLENAKP